MYGTVSADSSACLACPHGKTSNGQECVECFPGSFFSSGRCSLCPEGTFNHACTPCRNTSFCPPGSSSDALKQSDVLTAADAEDRSTGILAISEGVVHLNRELDHQFWFMIKIMACVQVFVFVLCAIGMTRLPKWALDKVALLDLFTYKHVSDFMPFTMVAHKTVLGGWGP